MSSLSFDNTSIAFNSQTNEELKASYRLFCAMNNTTLVKWTSPFARLIVLFPNPIRWQIRETIFKQFCGGETVKQCESTLQKLTNYEVGSILDYSVEGKQNEDTYLQTTNEIVQLIQTTAADTRIPIYVFKITGIGPMEILEKLHAKIALSETETESYTALQQRLDTIISAAVKVDKPIMIDAEESWIQDPIDALCTHYMQKYNTTKAYVYNTFQLYKTDSLAKLQQLTKLATKEKFLVGAKLVRGAYMEKERKRAAEMNYPSPIHKNKKATDKDFNAAVAYCLQNTQQVHIVIGSHNEESNLLATQYMQQYTISPSDKRVYFSQLLGMSDNISFNLAKAHYQVAKYVPYGPLPDVIPYLTRRAQENSSVEGQISRELTLIKQEINSRGL